MKPTYLERFATNSIMDLDEQREYMLKKVQRSKAGSSRFYPVFLRSLDRRPVAPDRGETLGDE